jgi:hypothetical protein
MQRLVSITVNGMLREGGKINQAVGRSKLLLRRVSLHIRTRFSVPNAQPCRDNTDNLQVAKLQPINPGVPGGEGTGLFPNILAAKTPLNAFVVNEVIGGATRIQAAFARPGYASALRMASAAWVGSPRISYLLQRVHHQSEQPRVFPATRHTATSQRDQFRLQFRWLLPPLSPDRRPLARADQHVRDGYQYVEYFSGIGP